MVVVQGVPTSCPVTSGDRHQLQEAREEKSGKHGCMDIKEYIMGDDKILVFVFSYWQAVPLNIFLMHQRLASGHYTVCHCVLYFICFLHLLLYFVVYNPIYDICIFTLNALLRNLEKAFGNRSYGKPWVLFMDLYCSRTVQPTTQQETRGENHI